MLFFLGFIAGFIVFGAIFATILYFKHPIQQAIAVAEKQVNLVSPRAKGFIIEAEDESVEIRRNIIAKNMAQGKETKLSELQ